MAWQVVRTSRNILNRIISSRSDVRVHNVSNILLSTKDFHSCTSLQKLVSFQLADIGEGIREVTVKEWFVKEGDVVAQFDNLCEVQSDKASVTITSRYDGKITKIHHQVDGIALVGKPLLDFDVVEENESSTESSESSDSDSEVHSSSKKQTTIEKQAATATDNESSTVTDRKALATPAVRRIAIENKVDLSKVTPTGPFGRVLKGDILEYLNMIPSGTQKPHATSMLPPRAGQIPKKDVAKPILAADRVETLKGVRKAMLKSMSDSQRIPHFAFSDEIDMTKLVALRTDLKQEAAKRGVKLTYMPFFIKAASIALSEYPILNSSLDLENESIVYKASHNISIAMDTPQGLVVPNIKNCNNKSLFKIAEEINDLQQRAVKGSLSLENFAGGTFSLSNIGNVGGTYTHPCIMPPQVAIGAIGQTRLLPRYNNQGELFPAQVMSVSWSADHRIIDGVTMAKFSNIWKNYLENPNLFLIYDQ